MRLGLLAVALILVVAPVSAQEALADESVATGDSKHDESKKDDSKKDDLEKDESQNKEAAGPDDPLSFVRRERDKLKEFGITFEPQEQSEVWGNLTGGGRRATSYNGLTIAKLEVDLDKAVGWSGAEFVVSALDIHGHGPTQSLVGNRQIVSSIEATPSIKLSDLWLDQSLLDNRLSVRVGQEGADGELMITQYGALFVNASFGFPGMAAADLPSGAPAYPLGAWYASNHFVDQRFDSAGGLLANPAGTGLALQHTGDWAVYGIIDQMVWKRNDKEDQGIGIFFRVMGGPSDRNLIDLYLTAGMNWRAPFASREEDAFGIAVSYLGISPAARRFSRDLIAFGGPNVPYAANETVVEATYTAPITSYLTLQPDIQLVLNPGAGIPGPFGRRSLADAVVIGTRATIKF